MDPHCRRSWKFVQMTLPQPRAPIAAINRPNVQDKRPIGLDKLLARALPSPCDCGDLDIRRVLYLEVVCESNSLRLSPRVALYAGPGVAASAAALLLRRGWRWITAKPDRPQAAAPLPFTDRRDDGDRRTGADCRTLGDRRRGGDQLKSRSTIVDRIDAAGDRR